MKFNYIILNAASAILLSSCQSNYTNSLDKSELLQDARRQERQKILMQFWQNKATDVQLQSTVSLNNNIEMINYPAGIYNNIKFSDRFTCNSDLTEPQR
jgi:hypothetical protein